MLCRRRLHVLRHRAAEGAPHPLALAIPRANVAREPGHWSVEAVRERLQECHARSAVSGAAGEQRETRDLAPQVAELAKIRRVRGCEAHLVRAVDRELA